MQYLYDYDISKIIFYQERNTINILTKITQLNQ